MYFCHYNHNLFLIIASVSLSLSIVNVHVLVWAGCGWVVSTQASAREVGVQACWREVWDLLNFCPKKTKLHKKKEKFYKFFLVFLSTCPAPPPSLPSRYVFRSRSPPQFCASQVSVGCQPTQFGFAPDIVPSRPLSVASRLSLVSSLCQTTVGCQPTISCFRPFSRAILALSVASRLSLVTPQVLCHPAHSRLPANSCGVWTLASTVTLSATNVCLATSAIVAFTLSDDIRGTLFRIF